MKTLLALALLSCLPALGAEEAWLPAPPTVEQVQQLPQAEQVAAAAAMKQVMFRRFLRLREERHRLTRENIAESAALAGQLNTPAIFRELLSLEAAEPLIGRDLYDYKQALNKTLAAYGVDALQIRLFVEGLRYPAAELTAAFEKLPIESVFNLLPMGTYSRAVLEEQLSALAGIYAQQLELYSSIVNPEQAVAASASLAALLPAYEATTPVRMVLISKENESLMARYQQLVQSTRHELNQQRKRLLESGFYGSAALAALDYLLN